MRTTVEPLEGNKVKLSVEVDEVEFEHAVDQAFRRIAREVRIPGFRPGKVPRRILEARLGSDVGRQEALREALPDYYAQAVREQSVDVIAAPDIDLTAGQESGPVAFDAVVEVRPRIVVPGYAGLRVTIPSPEVTDDEIDAQVERLRGQHRDLRSVPRPARDGDHVSIDIAGSSGGEPVEGLTADDYLYEVGSGAVVPEIDQHLRGAKVGDILVFTAAHPDPDEDELSFRVLVKDVKATVLPEVTDEWVAEVSELATVADLRADLRKRLTGLKRLQSQLAVQQGVIDALVALVDEEPPEALVAAEVERRAHDLHHRAQAQGVTLEEWLEASGRTPGDLGAELREQAASAVKADLALRAVADAEGLVASEDDVEAEIASLAVRLNAKPAALRRQLEQAEQLGVVRADVLKGKALAWLVEHAELVDEDGNRVDRQLLEPPADEGESDEVDEQDEAAGAATGGLPGAPGDDTPSEETVQ